MNASVPSLAVMLIVPGIITGAGFFTSAVCRPLIQGKVGPNQLYGIRTPLAFRSEEDWYRINRLGGAILSRWGRFVAAVGLVGFLCYFTGLDGMIAYNIVATALILGSLAVATMRIFRIR